MPRILKPNNLQRWECKDNVHCPKRKKKCSCAQESWSEHHSIPLKKLMGVEIDALPLRVSVEKFGGIDEVRLNHRWQLVREDLGIESTTSSGYQLNKAFKSYWENEIDSAESEDSGSEEEESGDSEESGAEEGVEEEDGDAGRNGESGFFKSGAEDGPSGDEMSEIEEEEEEEEEEEDEIDPYYQQREEYRTATCTPKNMDSNSNSNINSNKFNMTAMNVAFKPLVSKSIALPPLLEWKQSLLQAAHVAPLNINKNLANATAALDALEKQKASRVGTLNPSTSYAIGLIGQPFTGKRRYDYYNQEGQGEDEACWRAAKRGSGWKLVL